jgi:hypothetical protein
LLEHYAGGGGGAGGYRTSFPGGTKFHLISKYLDHSITIGGGGAGGGQQEAGGLGTSGAQLVSLQYLSTITSTGGGGGGGNPAPAAGNGLAGGSGGGGALGGTPFNWFHFRVEQVIHHQ